MDIRNCNRCGKIYQYTGLRICPTCRKEDEADFQKVREYLYKFPGANITEVHEATEVETNKIIEFLREGRLEIEAGGNLILECESCGVSISTGRFCDKCATSLQREIGQAARSGKTMKPRETGKFRVAERYKKRR